MNYLIWDFDGTLAYRTGMWSGTLLEVLRSHVPDCPVNADDLRPYLQSGFPWHVPERVRVPVQTAEDWWAVLLPTFEMAFQQGAGLPLSLAQQCARAVRARYVDPASWQLFDDVLPCLECLRTAGWRHIVLSNHVPELRTIMGAIGLAPYVVRVFNSAETGVEKPHPQAFLNVLQTLPDAQRVWVVGDSLTADIAGARAAGLPAVLVRRQDPAAAYSIATLTELPALLAAAEEPLSSVGPGQWGGGS